MNRRLSSLPGRTWLVLMAVLIYSGVVFGAAEKAPAPKFVKATPASGASMSTFDVSLEFDISETLSKLPEGKYGIGYSSSASVPGVMVYEGTEEGALVWEGGTRDSVSPWLNNVVEGNTVHLNIPFYLIASPNKTYTIKVASSFFVYDLESGKSVSGGYLFKDNPLILTYTGREPNTSEFVYTGVYDNKTYILSETIPALDFTFSQPVEVVPGAEVLLTSVGSSHSITYLKGTLSVDPENNCNVIATFPEKTLWKMNFYSVLIPSNSIRAAGDKNRVFPHELFQNIGGTHCGELDFIVGRSTNPLFLTGEVKWPEEFHPTSNKYWLNADIKYYEGKDTSGEPLWTEKYRLEENENSFIFPRTAQFEPGKEYTIVVEPFEWNGKADFEDSLDRPNRVNFVSERTEIPYIAPSLEEAKALWNIPDVSWGNVYKAAGYDKKNVALEQGAALSSALSLRLTMDGLYKKIDQVNSKWEIWPDPDKEILLYEVAADGTETLIESKPAEVAQWEDYITYFHVANLTFSANLYEDRNYKIVVPEGAFRVAQFSTKGISGIGKRIYTLHPFYYTSMPGYTFNIAGTKVSSLKIVDCSIKEGDELSELTEVRIYTTGRGIRNEEAKATLKYKNDIGSTILYDVNITPVINVAACSTNGEGVIVDIDQSLIILNFDYNYFRNPYALKNGKEYTLTLEPGLVCLKSDPNVATPEYVVHFKGVNAKPVEPVVKKISLTIEGAATTVTEVTGENTATFTLAPDAFWEIEKLLLDGEDVLADVKDGKYTTPALEADAIITAALKYAGELTFVDSSGVAVLPDTAISISTENDEIVVDGLVAGQMVEVYSVAGMHMASREATSDRLRIRLDKGQTYIVRVADKAAKILL